MANFDAAERAKAQLMLRNKFQSNELRFRSPEVFKLFLANTQFMTPDYLSAKTSVDRVLEMNYFLRTSRALGGAPSHNHTGTQGDSAVLTPTWNPYSDNFVSTLKEANNKIWTVEELIMSKIENVVANFAEGHETTSSDYLFANRSGVNVATADGTFDATDDVFQIAEALESDAMNITKVVMDANKYQETEYDIVCDAVAWRKFLTQAAQGAQNATNTAFQFNNVNFILDPKLTAKFAGLVGAYSKGAWIVVPKGSIGALPWIPVQNRQGHDSTVGNYGTLMNPVDGLDYALHSYETRADGTSLGGQLQDETTETELFIYIALAISPLSEAGETPVQAFVIV